MDKLFDIIVDQILSGVRSDGCRIDFRHRTSNDKVWTLSQMRENFNEVGYTHKEVFRTNKRTTQDEDDEYLEAVGELMATIPTFAECIDRDDAYYFENQIADYIQGYWLQQEVFCESFIRLNKQVN